MPTIYKPKRDKDRFREGNNRDADRRKIYNSAQWRRLRELKFVDSPLCEQCQRSRRTTPATDVHHIVSFMSTDDPVRRYQLAYDYDNLMSLCDECHSRIHAEERSVNVV